MRGEASAVVHSPSPRRRLGGRRACRPRRLPPRPRPPVHSSPRLLETARYNQRESREQDNLNKHTLKRLGTGLLLWLKSRMGWRLETLFLKYILLFEKAKGR